MRQKYFFSLGDGGFHRVAYTEWGDHDNPHVVVCVHGLARNSRDFDFLAEALAPDCRVVCMDVVGRGEPVDRKQAEGRRAVDEREVIVVAHIGQRAPELQLSRPG